MDGSNDNSNEYQSGAALLAAHGCTTREEKLTVACRALMQELENLHVEYEDQSLADSVDDRDVFCGCADAYRMGREALRE